MIWNTIDTLMEEGNYLVWDKAMDQPVYAKVTRESRGLRFSVHDSYGFNEDGSIHYGDVSHWTYVEGPDS